MKIKIIKDQVLKVVKYVFSNLTQTEKVYLWVNKKRLKRSLEHLTTLKIFKVENRTHNIGKIGHICV